MLELAYTMHRGRQNHRQEDCILVNNSIYQELVLPITTVTLITTDVLSAIADGVHASPVPHKASRMVLENLVKAIYQHSEWLQDGLIAHRHLRWVQTQLSKRLADNPKTCGSASTIVMAHLLGNQAAILNVGDSRAYHVSPQWQWQRLSKDHSILQGLIDKGEASLDVEYSGIYQMLDSVLCADHENNDFDIHRVTLSLQVGDTLVLCSDGIHEQIGEEKMWALFDPMLDVTAQTKVWRDAVWASGAKDNYSLIVARVKST